MEDMTYAVVYNDEEQYSVWPTDRDLPPGWYREGFAGPRDECLDHIEQIWPDIRPRSVRERIAAAQATAV